MTETDLELITSEMKPIRGQADAWTIRYRATFGTLDLSGRAVYENGALAIGSLNIEIPHEEIRKPRGNGLTAEVLKRLPLGALRRAIQRDLLELRLSEPRTATRLSDGATVPFEGTMQGRGRLRVPVPDLAAGEQRARLTDEYLRSLAELRVSLERDGVKAANRELAKRLRTTPATIANHLRAARERGYLAMARGGERVAMPGPLLIEWQNAQREQGAR